MRTTHSALPQEGSEKDSPAKTDLNSDHDAQITRSRMNLFAAKRTEYRSVSLEKRNELSEKYRNLSHTLANRKALDLLKRGNNSQGGCTCASCKKSIWFRASTADCPLCQETNHKSCLVGTVGVKIQQKQIEVDVCSDCLKGVNEMLAFDNFRNKLEQKSRLNIYYSAFLKLKIAITEILQSFGLDVIALTENSDVAENDDFVRCRGYHSELRQLLVVMQSTLKKLSQTQFQNHRDKQVAKHMAYANSVWISNHHDQIKVLEGHLREVSIAHTPVIVSRKNKEENTVAKPLLIHAIFPLVCEINAASSISISGENFDESVEVSIGGQKCSVSFKDSTLLEVKSPDMPSEGLNSVAVKVGKETCEIPAILIYTKTQFDNTNSNISSMTTRNI
tara:strand:- start:3503 stop:4675 length:1173 start_codon:yes stop_codon:yes gene_type:complete